MLLLFSCRRFACCDMMFYGDWWFGGCLCGFVICGWCYIVMFWCFRLVVGVAICFGDLDCVGGLSIC